jgi:glyoxylase I family protein
MKMHHIAISVSDLDKSLQFYKNILGFVEAKSFEREDLGARAVFITLDSIQIELWHFTEQTKNSDDLFDLQILGIKHLAFAVNNIEEKHKELKAQGIDISKPKTAATGKYCFFKDPDGIPLELYEEI